MPSLLVWTDYFSSRAARTSKPCRNKSSVRKTSFFWTDHQGELGSLLCSCGLRLTASSGELRDAVRY